MPINLDPRLIDNFRNQVNKNSIFRSIYLNKENKNLWNIICSAMDWISVTSEGLPQIRLNLDKGFGTNHLESLNLMQYIISIDILVEAIIQLFRVIEPKKDYPLFNDRSIFNQSNISDDKYFKHIRAVFGTHQVNLDSLDGATKVKGERFYASWTSKGIFGNYDYTVYLYSNNPEKDDLYPFGLVIREINEYAEKRYQLLEMLTQKIENFLFEHRTYKINEMIEATSDPIKQLDILFNENKKRYGIDVGYSNEINYLINMLQVELSTDDELIVSTVTEYKVHLVQQIPIIMSALQKLDSDDLSLWTSNAYGYEFEKIYSYIFDEHPLGKIYFNKLITCGTLPRYLLNVHNSHEKQLVFESILYKVAVTKGKRITYTELQNSNFSK